MVSEATLKIFDFGLIDFKTALQRQREIFSQVKNGIFEFALIISRHNPVITLGRRANRLNILATESELAKSGIPVYQSERGGDVTYHGPGQLTVYPVFNLNYLKKDVHLFLRQLENVVMDFLSGFGVKALRNEGFTGVWVEERKIASIGIAIKNWITFHGVSINIKKDDLLNFGLIKPCGMEIRMTSLENVLNRGVEIDGAKQALIAKFEKAFLLNREGR